MRTRLAALLLLLVVAVAAVWAVFRARPALVGEEEVRSAVLMTLARETPERFLVAGRLSSGLTTESARRWRVRLLDLEAGRATVTVSLPGEVTYGFPLDALTADDIRYLDGQVVEIDVPQLEVFAVEAVLEEAVVEATVTGTARLTPSLTEQSLQTALRRVRPALRAQAEAHLADVRQPRVNAAGALRAMIDPAIAAAGVTGPVTYRFVLAPGDTLVAAGGRRDGG